MKIIRPLMYRFGDNPHDAVLLDELHIKTCIHKSGVRRLAKSTQRIYRHAKQKLQRWAESAGYDLTYLGDLTPLIVEEYAHWLEDDSGLSVNTVNLHKRAIKAMFRYHHRGDLCEALGEKKVQHKPRALPHQLYGNLIALLVRDLAIVLFLRHTGVRRQSITRLRTADLRVWEEEAGDWRLIARVVEKGDKERHVMTGHELTCRTMKMWLDFKPLDHDQSVVFTDWENGAAMSPDTVSNLFYRLKVKAGIAAKWQVSPHALRHAYAQDQLDNGMSPDVLAALLGHESPQTTLDIYARPHLERLKDVVFGKR